MANTPLSLVTHHTKKELHSLWKKAKNPIERVRLRFLWKIRSENDSETILALMPEATAGSLGMSASWARFVVRTYNAKWLDGMTDGRKSNGNERIISEMQMTELKAKITSGESPDGGLWTGPKVALYLWEILGKKVSDVTGWNYLVSLGFSLQVPRPAHENRATPEEQEAFKKKLWNSSKKSKKRIRKK